MRKSGELSPLLASLRLLYVTPHYVTIQLAILIAAGSTLLVGSGLAEATPSQRPRATYILQPPPATSPAAPAGRRTVYMNRNGGVFTPGEDNASKNISAIPLQTSTVSAWSYGDEDWESLMTCMRGVFAPFNVEITDVDPGVQVHVEAVIGGMPSEVQLPEDVAGVASSFGCQVQESGVVFAFSEVWREYGSGQVESTCFTAAQEIGHAYGLDHQLTCGDPMTYLSCAGSFEFHDEDGDCGEDLPRACSCQGTTQNSYAHLMNLLGPNEVDDSGSEEPGEPNPEEPGSGQGSDQDSTHTTVNGCSTSGDPGGAWMTLLLGLVSLRGLRRRRDSLFS